MDSSLSLVLNGQNRNFAELTEGATLDQLVTALGLKGDRVAVEHNGEIVPRADWPKAKLTTGDKLELVHFVGGGLGT
ncbi:MAG: sulfur carrier protein ThiS [Acidobacteriaceae bacterium]